MPYLRIHVRWLHGHYHGEEWPPSPLRLVQAVVAGSASAGELETADTMAAYRWWESQPAPVIHAEARTEVTPFTAYVPRNSDDLTLREYYRTADLGDMIASRRARYDGQATQRRWVHAPVTYEWSIEKAPAAAAVCRLAEELVCLGRSEDLAFATAELSEQPLVATDRPVWRPSAATGRSRYRVPAVGSFDSLLGRHEARRRRIRTQQFVDPEIAFDERRYATAAAAAGRAYFLYELRRIDDGRGLYSWDHHDGVAVAAMIRHALNECVPSEHRGYAMGHSGDDLADRLSWVPLPSLGHQHVDGRIRRALLVAPPGEAADSARLQEIRHAMRYSLLRDQAGEPVAALVESEERSAAIERYLVSSRKWRTVTPVFLHGRTTRGGDQKGKFDPRKAEKLIAAAFAKSRLPDVVAFHYRVAPFERSGRSAREYRFPARLKGLSRFHISVEFAQDVRGPLIVGVGRHYGLGLFAAPPAVQGPTM